MSRRSSRTTTSAATGLLLLYEIRIDNGGKSLLIADREHTPQFTPRRGHAARDDQRRATEIDEAHLSAFVNPPPTP